ncbi:MAG: hypothetical protein ACM3Q2_01860, partial [Syntrophothermus sp.]
IKAQVPAPENLKAEVISNEMQKGVKLTWVYTAKILVKYAIYRKDGLASDTGAFRKVEKTALMPYYMDANVINGKK